MIKKLVLSVLILIVLGGCGASNKDAPTPTAAPIPLKDIDLLRLAIQSGDLPEGYSKGQPTRVEGQVARDKGFIKSAGLGIENDGVETGGVNIYLYESLDQASESYTEYMDSLVRASEYPNVEIKNSEVLGEKAAYAIVKDMSGGDFIDLVFVRCHAVAYIRMATQSVPEVLKLGVSLDYRLKPLVCP